LEPDLLKEEDFLPSLFLKDQIYCFFIFIAPTAKFYPFFSLNKLIIDPSSSRKPSNIFNRDTSEMLLISKYAKFY